MPLFRILPTRWGVKACDGEGGEEGGGAGGEFESERGALTAGPPGGRSHPLGWGAMGVQVTPGGAEAATGRRPALPLEK